MVVKNMAQLRTSLERRVQKALEWSQKEIYDMIQEYIRDYYDEKVFEDAFGRKTNVPKEYIRTYQFFNSLIKSEIIVNNGKLSCSVGIDTDSLDYVQSGDTVINMINKGFHADTKLNEGAYQTPYSIASESNFWDDAIDELGEREGILNIIKKNLRKAGIPVR